MYIQLSYPRLKYVDYSAHKRLYHTRKNILHCQISAIRLPRCALVLYMIYPNVSQEIYYVYILLCNDNSYYIGLTNDLTRRFKELQEGVYPYCYTYKRSPLLLVYYEAIPFLKEATEREQQLKRWSRAKKKALVEQNYHKLHLLAECNNMSHSMYKDFHKK
jgi:predicted GIY-YIG superfamily endonuclease